MSYSHHERCCEKYRGVEKYGKSFLFFKTKCNPSYRKQQWVDLPLKAKISRFRLKYDTNVSKLFQSKALASI